MNAPAGPSSSEAVALPGLSAMPPTDMMEVDVEDTLNDHEAPVEKTDADFFNDFEDDFDDEDLD
jgi:hypothetical protein